MSKEETPLRYTDILWDWDGTLGMTLEEWVTGYAETFATPSPNNPSQPRIIATRAEIIASMGSFRRRIHEYWQQPQEVADQLVAETHQRVAPRLERVRLYPGAAETVRTLAQYGLRQAIATKSHRHVVEQAARHNDIHGEFGAFVGGNELHETEQKPHRQSVDLALQRLGGEAVGAIIIGDSLTDLLTARNANIPSILYFPPENEPFYDIHELLAANPTYIVNHLAEVIDIVT